MSFLIDEPDIVPLTFACVRCGATAYDALLAGFGLQFVCVHEDACRSRIAAKATEQASEESKK